MQILLSHLVILLVLVVNADFDKEFVEKVTKIYENEKFLWYAPHGGFGNQMIAFRNALRLAGILNRSMKATFALNHFFF